MNLKSEPSYGKQIGDITLDNTNYVIEIANDDYSILDNANYVNEISDDLTILANINYEAALPIEQNNVDEFGQRIIFGTLQLLEGSEQMAFYDHNSLENNINDEVVLSIDQNNDVFEESVIVGKPSQLSAESDQIQVTNSCRYPSVLINGFKAYGLFPWNKNQIDFKKCLGKNYDSNGATSSTQHTDNNINNLNLKEFSDIIGIETLEKFNNIQNIVETEHFSEEFFILYRVYEKLKKDNQYNTEVDSEKENCNADQSLSGICATRSSEKSLSMQNQLEKEIIDTPSPINHPSIMIPSENHVILNKIEISQLSHVLFGL